jgi:hypothetical protein
VRARSSLLLDYSHFRVYFAARVESPASVEGDRL